MTPQNKSYFWIYRAKTFRDPPKSLKKIVQPPKLSKKINGPPNVTRPPGFLIYDRSLNWFEMARWSNSRQGLSISEIFKYPGWNGAVLCCFDPFCARTYAARIYNKNPVFDRGKTGVSRLVSLSLTFRSRYHRPLPICSQCAPAQWKWVSTHPEM